MKEPQNLEEWLEANASLRSTPGSPRGPAHPDDLIQTLSARLVANQDVEMHVWEGGQEHGNLLEQDIQLAAGITRNTKHKKQIEDAGYPKWEIIHPGMQINNADIRKLYLRLCELVNDKDTIAMMEHRFGLPHKLSPEDMKAWNPTLLVDAHDRLSIRLPKKTAQYLLEHSAGQEIAERLSVLWTVGAENRAITNKLSTALAGHYPTAKVEFSPKENPGFGTAMDAWKVIFPLPDPEAARKTIHPPSSASRAVKALANEASNMNQQLLMQLDGPNKTARRIARDFAGGSDIRNIHIDSVTSHTIEISFDKKTAPQVIYAMHCKSMAR